MQTKLRSRTATALMLLALGLATSATAQQSSRIQFERGNDNAAASGSVTGHEYRDYVLGARAGQTMSVALSVESGNADGSAFFNILPPGSDGVAIFTARTARTTSAASSCPITATIASESI